MASCRFLFVAAMICSVMVVGRADITKPPTEIIDLITTRETDAMPIVSTVEPNTPATTEAATTEAATTEAATTEPTTEPPKTEKPTTEKPTTETPKTTEKTTTSTEKTTTTTSTEAPTTTVPPPTPAPGPLPPPDQGLWAFNDTKLNVTCVIVQFAAQINVTYPKTVDKASALGTVVFNVPANATVTHGNCNGTRQWLVLSWPADSPVVDDTNNMTIMFKRNDTAKTYSLKSLNVSMSRAVFPNISYTGGVNLYHGVAWQTPLASSYRCGAVSQLNLTSDSGAAATLDVSRLQEEAFRTTGDKGFSAARDCAGADIPDAVPIAVGCALGGMVLVVLVAYLVARRRSAARGYLSM